MSRRHIPWTPAVLLLWVILLAVSVQASLAPASDWFEVRSVYVADTTAGASPVMTVDREVKKPFRGRWLVDVEQEQPSGRFVVRCTAAGANNYSLGNDLPVPLDLDWWTYPMDCAPTEPGRYRVETTWLIELPGGLTKEVRAVSNTFRVSR